MSYLPLIRVLGSKAFSFFKKALLVFIVFYSVISIFFYFMGREKRPFTNNPYTLQKQKIYATINDPVLNKTKEGRMSISIYKGINCTLLGEGCTNDPADANQYKNGSLFGGMTNLIATPYSSPPASAIAWLQDGLQNSGMFPSVYAAQGTGFSSLKGYISIWKMFRNISFLILVIFMLVIGFMIMFRVKADGQTAIGLQNALPKIVITIILITFSFAIVGFLIDLMYIFIGLIVDLVMGYGMGIDGATVASYQNDFIGAKFNDLWPAGQAATSMFGVGSSLWNMVPASFRAILEFGISPLASKLAMVKLEKWEPLMSSINGVIILGHSLGNLPWLVKFLVYLTVTGVTAHFLPGLILGLVIVLTVLFLMFKLFFIVLSSYIKIILYTLFAPIILLFEAIPGQNSFSWWIKSIIGELIVFPTIVLVMLGGNAIIAINSGGDSWLGKYGPIVSGASEFKSSFVLPFLYGFRPEDFNALVGLGVILLIPDIIKLVKGYVGGGESPLNLGLGTFLSGGAALVGGAWGGAGGFRSIANTLNVPRSKLPLGLGNNRIGKFLIPDDPQEQMNAYLKTISEKP